MGYFITMCLGFILGGVLGLIANKKLKKRYSERYQEELDKTYKHYQEVLKGLDKNSKKEG